MQELVERIKTEGRHVGGGIVKVDGFLNHQVDPALTDRMGEQFVRHFADAGPITRILTAEASGIPPAVSTARLLNVPMVYARKSHSALMEADDYQADAISRTKGNAVTLRISRRFLHADDRVLIIDDFLASGSTLAALVAIIEQAGATLAGIGCVIEKPQEGGRERLAGRHIPIVTLAKITFDGDTLHVYA